MNKQSELWLKFASSLPILIVALTLPFLFWGLSTDFFETPKYLVVLVATLILLLTWSLRVVLENKITFTKTPLDLPLLLLLIVIGIATFFSKSYPVAILGNTSKIHQSLSAWVVYILFYFVLVNALRRSPAVVKNVISILTVSALCLAVLSLLYFLGLKLPFPLTKAANFTPAGSTFSALSLVLLTLPFMLLRALEGKNLQTRLMWVLLLVIPASTLALTGSLSLFIAAGATLGLTLFITPRSKLQKNAPFLVLPLVIGIALWALASINLKFLGPANPATLPFNILAKQAVGFPRELQLPFTTSWKVSVSAFRDSPFWGTGPASYLFDFTLYKPLEHNNNKFWNIRFDNAFNEYLEVLATLGLTGLLALALLTVVFISSASKVLSSEDLTTKALAVSGITFFILLLLHPSTLVSWVLGIIILALFMSATKKAQEVNLNNLSLGGKNSSVTQAFDAMPGVVLMVVLILTGFVLFFAGKFALASYHHRQALDAVTANKGVEAYNELVKAEQLNPYSDRYRVDLAQTNFALANAIAASKATEASPSAELSDQDKQNIQTLLAQAINEGKAATTLSPNNPQNWEILASLYRQIAGVAQNALSFALDSYGRAIQKDPLNPNLRLNAGGVYYAAKNYDLAIRFFTDSVSLKPDFANGYYNLAVAFRDKGDLASATVAAEKVLTLVEKESLDYATASKLLEELKQESTPASEPPAAQTDSALGDERKKLPKVLDLPQPDKITTPSAVKKSKAAN